MSFRTWASVRCCCFSCLRYLVSLLLKYRFLMLARRSETCLSVTLMPSDEARSARSACWTSSVTALLLIDANSAVPCLGNVLPRLRFACASSVS